MGNRSGRDKIKVGNITASNQAINIGGKQNTATVTVAATANTDHIDVTALTSALRELFSTLGTMRSEAANSAQIDVGTAVDQGIKDGKIRQEVLLSSIQTAGDTLKKANVTVAEGSQLWHSITKMASLLGPLVGGAQIVSSWFGL